MSPGGPAASGPVGLKVARERGGERPIRPVERACIWGLLVLLMAEHMAFGAGRRESAMAFTAAQGLLLAAFAATPLANGAPRAMEALRLPAALFVLVLAAAAWSLTPWTPGGPHPVWSYVEAVPASAVDKGGVIIEMISLLGLAAVFLAAWLLGLDDRRSRRFLTLLVAGIALYAGWAFAAHLIDPQTIYGFVRKTTHDNRLTGSFLSSNTTGSFLAMGAVLLAASLVEQWRVTEGARWDRRLSRGAWRLAGLAFCLAALILTASRSAVVAGAAVLMIFLIWEAVSWRWRLFGPAGASLLAMLTLLGALLWIGGTTLFERLLEVSDDADIRKLITSYHWQAFLASPLMGYGLGSFDEVNRLIATAPDLGRLWNVRATHNVYVQWLEEAGVIGATPMFLCIGALLASIVVGSWRRRRMTTWLRAIVCASLLLLIHGATDFGLQIPSIAAQWAALLGLGLAVANNSGRQA